jgi:hypothetical protein
MTDRQRRAFWWAAAFFTGAGMWLGALATFCWLTGSQP